MDMYQEEVMEHYEHPRNQGEIDNPNYEGRDSNASCGDMVQFQIKVKEGKIIDVGWKGIGCAITTAAASKLSEFIKNKEIVDLQKLSEEEMTEKGVGFTVNPGRTKCLTLPGRVIIRLVNQYKD